MDKLLLNSENDFYGWKLNEGKYSGLDFTKKPTSYPCYVLWHVWDVKNQCSDNGVHGFVYPEDFIS